MKTTTINIKTTPEVKAGAQQVARELGFSLSSLINAYLRDLTRTKKVSFELPEIPNEATLQALKEAEEEPTSPTFTSASEAIDWLHNNDME
ncbi:type II toxin-antitoxin system RelB/DinJ family antitoxin [candidate division WWE3 bacterium]|uniref:Type II toxin-antitoxin system RelB/DinJ family antitoxin n=1 Tax=candidate division WWE3 bacterium TaxID=2053526 RepID=A0A955LJI3_UNCKA|nr:type II toxin-antitoxin system RelB/DinJ family antitoxin [candidate division WWE3 bacterium]